MKVLKSKIEKSPGGSPEPWEEGGANLISLKGFWETFGPHDKVPINRGTTNEIASEKREQGHMEKGGPGPLTVHRLFFLFVAFAFCAF